jgi:hypothetical protein
LEFYEAKAEASAASGSAFSLDPDDCALLMREGMQYYHRYLSAFQLERFELVARDTKRNLRLFAFVAQHALRQRDKIEFDRYRPYVEMMYARACASQALKKGDHRSALSKIDDGIKAIRRFLVDYEQQKREAECSELAFLLRWRREIEKERPVGPLEHLERQLELSVELEDYEEAARLRDQIRRLQESDSPPGRARSSPRSTPL